MWELVSASSIATVHAGWLGGCEGGCVYPCACVLCLCFGMIARAYNRVWIAEIHRFDIQHGLPLLVDVFNDDDTVVSQVIPCKVRLKVVSAQ
jgi:hypothetical protein